MTKINISRRTLVRALGAITATGGAGAALAAADLTELPGGISQGTWDSYAARSPAHERLRHHLLAAALTMDEIVAEEGVRWAVSMGGYTQAFDARYLATRFDARFAPHPKLPRDMRVEDMKVVAEFASQNRFER